MPADTTKKPKRNSLARSRISNGSKLLASDGRSIWARRLRDLIEDYSADIGATSEMQRSMIRRAATLTVELERAEASFAEKGEADSDALAAYQTTANSLRRILETLGLSKVPVKEAAEVARQIEGVRISRAVVDGLGVEDYGLAVGGKQARLDFARRLVFAIENAIRTGEPIPRPLAEFAAALGYAQVDDPPEPEEQHPPVTVQNVAKPQPHTVLPDSGHVNLDRRLL